MNEDALNIYESLLETVDETQLAQQSAREISVPNIVRCPFYEEPVSDNQRYQSAKYVKRTQRHRSTAQSRLGDMTVGDIRYCFQQLRNAGKNLSPEMMLYNGQSAGEFALKYLRETSTAMRKRRKQMSIVVVADSEEDVEAQEGRGEETKRAFPLGVHEKRNKQREHSPNVLQF